MGHSSAISAIVYKCDFHGYTAGKSVDTIASTNSLHGMMKCPAAVVSANSSTVCFTGRRSDSQMSAMIDPFTAVYGMSIATVPIQAQPWSVTGVLPVACVGVTVRDCRGFVGATPHRISFFLWLYHFGFRPWRALWGGSGDLWLDRSI